MQTILLENVCSLPVEIRIFTIKKYLNHITLFDYYFVH